MKTFVSILLATLVLVSTSGVAVTKHFCGTSVASVSVLGDGGCSCVGTHAENKNNCCHSDREFFQVDDDFVATSSEKLNFFHRYCLLCIGLPLIT